MRLLCNVTNLDIEYFNPRTHVGCDHQSVTIFDLYVKFQSTHPRGVRHGREIFNGYDLYFNPRTHVGCDIRGDMEKGKLHRFQSTHPRGVRRFAKMLGTGPRIFQSTHPRGVRRSAYLAEWSLSTISIHAPTWGATQITKKTKL